MSALCNGIPRAQGITLLVSSSAASSVSSGTAETQLASITVPANLMGANGSLRITTWWSYTNNANTKTLRVRFGGSGGQTYATVNSTTLNTSYLQQWIRNNNSTSAQKGFAASAGAFSNGVALALTTSAVDTTSATTIYISGQTATSGDTITLEGYTVEFIPGV